MLQANSKRIGDARGALYRRELEKAQQSNELSAEDRKVLMEGTKASHESCSI